MDSETENLFKKCIFYQYNEIFTMLNSAFVVQLIKNKRLFSRFGKTLPTFMKNELHCLFEMYS